MRQVLQRLPHLAFALSFLLPALSAEAHQGVMGVFRIDLDGEAHQGRWATRLDARDLKEFLRLDTNKDDKVDREEIEAGRETIATYLRQRISLTTDGVACEHVAFGDIAVDNPRDATLVDLRGTIQCPQRFGIVDVGNQVLFDHMDTYQHYGVIVSSVGRVEQMFTVRNSVMRVQLGEPLPPPEAEDVADGDGTGDAVAEPIEISTPTSSLERIGNFIGEGFVHIFLGYDHILFILGLIIAAGNLRRLALIVTAFTVAHSITLALASLGAISVPLRLAEAMIALSVAYIGFENLITKPKRRALLAFAFGLIHGVSFSTVLAERVAIAGMGGHELQLLFGFNVGVELGQLVIVTAIYPIVALARKKGGERWVIAPPSVLILGFGLWWFVERAFLG